MNSNLDNYLILDPVEHSLLIWHWRLGHASLKTIQRALETTRGIDLTIPLTIKRLPFCKAYALGKSRKNILQSLQQRADRPSQKLYVDLARLITPIRISKVC